MSTLFIPSSYAPASPPTRQRSVRPPHPRPALALVAVTAAWGATFPMFKVVLRDLPVADFLAVRFVIAALVLTLCAPFAVVRLSAGERRRAAALGLVYGSGQIASTIGLSQTSASVSGFVTGLYVVATPVLAVLLLRRRPPRTVWVAVGIATLGLGVLGLNGTSFGPGVPITLLGALLYALHVLGMGQWARRGNALGMTVVQLWVVAAVSLAFALPGGVQAPRGGLDWAIIGYGALVSGALALVAQTWAQAQLTAERAAIIMTTEPVWAAASSVLAGEVLTHRLLVGGALVLGGMLVAELSSGRRSLHAPVSPTPVQASRSPARTG